MNIRKLIERWTGHKGLNRLELVQLRVSLLISALDGNISSDEMLEFRRIAQASENWTAEAEREAFYSAIRSAGYLMLLSRVATKEELLLEFVAEAERVLPMFRAFSEAERQASVDLWKNVAQADGDFADVEREAIECLEKRLLVQAELERMAATGGYYGIR